MIANPYISSLFHLLSTPSYFHLCLASRKVSCSCTKTNTYQPIAGMGTSSFLQFQVSEVLLLHQTSVTPNASSIPWFFDRISGDIGTSAVYDIWNRRHPCVTRLSTQPDRSRYEHRSLFIQDLTDHPELWRGLRSLSGGVSVTLEIADPRMCRVCVFNLAGTSTRTNRPVYRTRLTDPSYHQEV